MPLHPNPYPGTQPFLFAINSESTLRHNMSSDTLDLFPLQTPSYILSFQFSSWYPAFSDVSIKSTVIRPLSDEFKQYLESESVFVPEGSEDACVVLSLHRVRR